MGAVVSVSVGLVLNRKYKQLQRMLGASDRELVGGLTLFWSAVRRDEPDGNVAGWSAEEIGYSACWPEPEAFGKGLRECGFVDPDGTVHDWIRHSGRQLRDAERKRAERAQKSEAVQGPSADNPRTVQGPSTERPPSRAPAGRDGTGQEEENLEALPEVAGATSGGVGPKTLTLESLRNGTHPLSAPSRRNGAEAEPAGFPAWYETYPRHVARQDAARAFRSVVKTQWAEEALPVNTQEWVERWLKEGRDLTTVPYPATFLRRGDLREPPRAEDE